MQEKAANLKKHLDTSTELTSQQLLDIMQVTNANFPIGSFSHSFGIETYIRIEYIHDVKTLKEMIKSYIYGQFLYADLLGMILVYKALEDQDFDKIWEIDHMLHAQGMAKETRDGARRIGTQMVKIYEELFNDENSSVKKYSQKIKKGECTGVPGVAFALLAHSLKIDIKTALYTHLYGSISALIQNSVRAIPLGQVQGQKLVLEVKREYFDEVIHLALTADLELEFCKNNPGFEIAQMEHEDMHIRLFMS